MLVARRVPALVCDNCGEEYLGTDETERLLIILDALAAEGVRLEVRDYAAA
jgi:hypothetical protein